MRLHSYDPSTKKGTWKARSEGRERRIIRNAQKLFSDSDPVQLEALVIGKATDPALQTTRKRGEVF